MRPVSSVILSVISHGRTILTKAVSDEMKAIGTKLILLLIWFTANSAFAIPLPRTEKTTIQGTVVDWTWRGEIDFQQEFQGHAYGQTIPAHYIVRLKLQMKRSELYNTINWYSRLLPIGIGINVDELQEDEVIVYLPTQRLNGFLRDAKLTIEGYSIVADDSGPDAECIKILINGATPDVLPPVFPKE